MSEVYQFAEGFQLKILAMMARDKSFYASYRDVLQPKYFRKDVHIDVARILHDFYEDELVRAQHKKTPINAPSVEVLFEEIRKLLKNNEKKSKLRHQYEDCIADIVDVDLSDAEYIKDSVVKFGKDSAMRHAIMDSVNDLEKGDFDTIYERIGEALRIGDDLSDLGVDFFEEASERIEQYQKGGDGTRRIPTGLSGIDKVTRGGLGNGELGVVIAPPNRGKSFALINIGAGAIMEGYNVVHYTLEMPERQVAKRYDNRLIKRDLDYMKDNPEKTLMALMNIQKINKGKLIIKKYKTNECSVNSIRSHLTRLKMEKGFVPDLIIVDYGDLLQPRRTYSDKRFELESIYLDLRDLGDEFSCPVWTASQANRGALDKKIITLADLAEAFNKANIADFMVALCQTVEEKRDLIMRWHIAKFRDGEANITLDGDIDYGTAVMTAILNN
ncbi:Replicative DNA helicase [compost metagenome]